MKSHTLSGTAFLRQTARQDWAAMNFCFHENVEDTVRIQTYAESLNRNVQEGSFSFNKNLHLTVSIGISLCRECTSFEELYVQADTMLYEVKNQNRNGYKIYDK